MFEALSDPQIWISLLTLTALEIVLGIDNIIFISILAGKLPAERRDAARRIGLIAALLTRLALLASIAWVARLTTPLFSAGDFGVSGRDLILIVGGLFLLYKSTREIHDSVEIEEESEPSLGRAAVSFGGVIVQIMILDIVFSLDSVITAVGMSDNLAVMIAAVIIAVGVMLFASGPVGDFVNRHPTLKMLALAFLLLVGVALIADGLGFHIPKGYIYFAIAFSAGVESLNLWASAKRKRARAVKVDGPRSTPS